MIFIAERKDFPPIELFNKSEYTTCCYGGDKESFQKIT